ncbi:MAG: ROK family transcriptional regulator [Succinatimonas sp.]|nr:ROK family transcriptional regulator [Succinatimonas sp.]
MKDSADIRVLNSQKIVKLLLDGKAYTKFQIASHTQLSVATANTLLNDLYEKGVVVGDSRQLQSVGRKSVCYQLNANYLQIACIDFELIKAKRTFRLQIIDALGSVIETLQDNPQSVTAQYIIDTIKPILRKYPKIKYLMVGIPGLIQDGVVQHCDCSEMDNSPLLKLLEDSFKCPVHIENDMHYKAYGYYKLHGHNNDVVTLANFPSYILPGTSSINEGKIVRGFKQFAGMVGFLPLEITKEKLLQKLNAHDCKEYVAKFLTSIAVVVNPRVMVLTGDLLDKDSSTWIIDYMKKFVPGEYLPQFEYLENFDEIYLQGMYQRAIDFTFKKEI